MTVSNIAGWLKEIITVTSCTSFIQIAETRSDLEKANRNATTTELDLRKELDMQRRHKEEEMAALSMQHTKRLEEMIEQHKEELRKLEGIKDEELKVLLRYNVWEKDCGWVVLPFMAYN